MGILKLGTISLDGTKIKANASKHKALSWKYALKLEKQLREEVETLLRLAEEVDNRPAPEKLDIPAELARREARLVAIEKARKEIEARARERARHEREKVEILRMHAKRFVNAFIRVPCQIVRSGRRVIYRLLGWNRWQAALLRMADDLRYPLRC